MSPVLDIELMRRRHLKAIMPIEEVVYPRPWSVGVFNAEIDLTKSGERYYVVGTIDGRLVGYAGMLFTPDDAHVTNIAVDPEWQRRGIATELLLELCWKARERECQGMSLEVRARGARRGAPMRKRRSGRETKPPSTIRITPYHRNGSSGSWKKRVTYTPSSPCGSPSAA